MDLDVHLPAIGAGDAEAFAAWLAGAERPVRSSLRSFAHVVDTEAVVQETLLRIWQVAPKVESDGRENSLLRLALRIARNLAIDLARRQRSEPLDLVALEHLEAEPVGLPDPMLREALVICRDELRPAPRRAFDARLRGGDDRALAARLGMSLNTFLKNVGRARKALLECLRRRGVALELA